MLATQHSEMFNTFNTRALFFQRKAGVDSVLDQLDSGVDSRSAETPGYTPHSCPPDPGSGEGKQTYTEIITLVKTPSKFVRLC